ncbi:hypothetical protein JL721_9144 [Aureococcus anophagefferens]|nr:hypothetical protein JL721_9144 [Aureococcus anophagefferens]
MADEGAPPRRGGEESRQLRARLEAAEARIEAQADDLAATKARVAAAEENVQALQDKVSGLDDLEETVKSQGLRLTALHETQQAMGARFDKRFEAAEGALARVEGRVGSVEGAASRLEGRVDKLKEELLVPAHNVTLPADLQAEGEAGGSEDDVAKLTHLLGVFGCGAAAAVEPGAKMLEHAEAIDGKASIDLKCKVSYDDVDVQVEGRYAEILKYLQSTLRATEADDDDVRREAEELRLALNEMRMTKADRGDLAQLRAQVATQVDDAMGATEIEELRRDLDARPRRAELFELLTNKVSFSDLQRSIAKLEQRAPPPPAAAPPRDDDDASTLKTADTADKKARAQAARQTKVLAGFAVGAAPLGTLAPLEHVPDGGHDASRPLYVCDPAADGRAPAPSPGAAAPRRTASDRGLSPEPQAPPVASYYQRAP